MNHPSPLPTLTRYCNVKLSNIRKLLARGIELDTLHVMVTRPTITEADHKHLFDLAMTEWGINGVEDVQSELWKCYFPKTRPHIFHILVYRLHVPIGRLMGESGLSKRQIEKDLREPLLYQPHLQAIARYAMRLHDSLASVRTWDGVDPRAQEIHQALSDPARMRKHGQD